MQGLIMSVEHPLKTLATIHADTSLKNYKKAEESSLG
jgi:hypothetical protein